MRASDADAIDRLIGRNIRFHRLVRELSQAKLAGEIGISFQQLQKYNRISASRLFRVAEVLGTPVDVFFKSLATDQPSPGPLPNDRPHDKSMRACLGLTDPKLRSRIAQLLETIASRCSF
jgi:transcriptional regulator with XRE-family HTH domain